MNTVDLIKVRAEAAAAHVAGGGNRDAYMRGRFAAYNNAPLFRLMKEETDDAAQTSFIKGYHDEDAFQMAVLDGKED